nr:immunoglobulin heavy chain junction region [Macaca mulatta]MOV48555.1 immunoglobulin heavy chain junction region [Macaca mulatta]MOV48659.1 immunoglobulin heavy chain junction region [Macaca mulatta]
CAKDGYSGFSRLYYGLDSW